MIYVLLLAFILENKSEFNPVDISKNIGKLFKNFLCGKISENEFSKQSRLMLFDTISFVEFFIDHLIHEGDKATSILRKLGVKNISSFPPLINQLTELIEGL